MTPGEAAARIEAAGRAIDAELATMPETLSSWHPAEGEWCVKDVLGHIIQTERLGFGGRIREMLGAREPALKATSSAPPACGRSLIEMLGEFRRERLRSVELVAGLSAADLLRGGLHERVGRLTVNDIVHEWVHHDRAHLKQILGNVQEYVWPDMGGAQAFVRPG